MAIRNVCVYCGSAPGSRPVYREHARRFARTLAARGVGLVYGGGSVGLMGTIADAMLEHGGRVIGVIPRPLAERELAHTGLTELRITESMHERKAWMAELADAFVALPGGAGTLEELFEIWTWAQLGMHAKPCGILDVAGYYEGLVGFLDHAVAEGFLQPRFRSMLLYATDPDDLLDRFERYEPPRVTRWVRESET